MPPYYIVHPGTVRLQQTGEEVYVDAAELASLYGLVFGEYQVGSDQESGSIDQDHIHLSPREDAKYADIKLELGDVPVFYSKPAFWDKKKHMRGDRIER